nr:hypothetical protein [Tanacetum cinerariifolium]
MRDEHLSTILETKLDKVIKSSVKNLVPIPSESEVTSDNESECDVPVNDESSPIFTTFSNPLFDCTDDFTSSDDKPLNNKDVPMIYSNSLFVDEEIISTKIDPHYFNAESNLLESLLNRDTFIDSSPKFDYLLEELSSELAHIDLIPPGIEEANFDLEEEIHLVQTLLYDNSSPRPPKEHNVEIANTIVESLAPSPIPVEDSDSQMEEIDLFLATDDLMPPGIEIDDYDSKGNIHFLEELLSNDPFTLPENESSNFDHYDNPSFPRPPSKPPNVKIFFDFEPDTGVLTAKVVEVISEHYVLMLNILPSQPALCPNIDTLLLFSSENEDKVFKPDILSYFLVSHQDKIISNFSKNPIMMYGEDIPLLNVLSLSHNVLSSSLKLNLKVPPKAVCASITTTTISSKQSQDKGKAIMIEEPVKPNKKDQIRLDEEAALKLQAELQAEFNEEQRIAREKAQKEQEANIAIIEE